MRAWLCYRPDHGEDASDGVSIEASNARDAANDYAQRKWSGADPFDSLEIEIVAEDGEVWTATVDVECVPEFYTAICSRKVTP